MGAGQGVFPVLPGAARAAQTPRQEPGRLCRGEMDAADTDTCRPRGQLRRAAGAGGKRSVAYGLCCPGFSWLLE